MGQHHVSEQTPPPATGNETLVVFIHGFTGADQATWGPFPELLTADRELTDYVPFFWGYPSELNLAYLITKFGWKDDPDIPTIAEGLRTMLDTGSAGYRKLVLVGHSMGGLVIQKFIVDELRKNRHQHLERLTHVILFGTPSGGHAVAQWFGLFKNQVADMSRLSPFIKTLRNDWARLVDGRRAAPDTPVQFLLTLVAGMQDEFVPQWSSLDPFSFGEKAIVPGDHITLVKAQTRNDLAYQVVKQQLLRSTLTFAERQRLNGADPAVVVLMEQIRAAADLEDTDGLQRIAATLLNAQQPIPPIDRVLGFALLELEHYSEAVALLRRYLEFRMPDGSHPAERDDQAHQQYAIALSGIGDDVTAVAELNRLRQRVGKDPETIGILAGRFKRQWRKREQARLGWQAFNLYREGFEVAREHGPLDKATYNGVNAAYLNFALGDGEYRTLAQQTLDLCSGMPQADYWVAVTQAEALLLLGQYEDAYAAYLRAERLVPTSRQQRVAGEQAQDIIKRQGHPPAATSIASLFPITRT